MEGKRKDVEKMLDSLVADGQNKLSPFDSCKHCGKNYSRKSSFCKRKIVVQGVSWASKILATIKEIIHILNVREEEEKKTEVLASSRKRADILYPLSLK